MITKGVLRRDLPEERTMEDGRVNSVLALWRDSIWCETNTYLCQWTVCNTAYYRAHPEEFEGWFPLEDALLPKRLRHE